MTIFVGMREIYNPNDLAKDVFIILAEDVKREIDNLFKSDLRGELHDVLSDAIYFELTPEISSLINA